MSLSIIRQVRNPNSNQLKNLLRRAVGGIFQSSSSNASAARSFPWSPISVLQPQPQLLPQQHDTPLPSVYDQLYGMNGKSGSGPGLGSSSSVLQMDGHGGITTSIGDDTSSSGILEDLSTWLISTLKRRKKKMNKHKLQKRRKKLRLSTKK
eukprot:210375_1